MNAVPLRTASLSLNSSAVSRSPRVSLSVHDSASASGEKSCVFSPRISLHVQPIRRGIRRSLSESDVIRSVSEFSDDFSRLSSMRSPSFASIIPEEAQVSDFVGSRTRSSNLLDGGSDRMNYSENWAETGISSQELGFPGDGVGAGSRAGGGGGGAENRTGGFAGGHADRRKIGAYYQEMLKSNPTDSLLLRNYAKFLHEVEKDTVKAEEYYGRAILANPEDGEVLSLYGELIWETEKDGIRAKSYFDQAVKACPDDCTVLGSYARFMWEADEDEEEDDGETGIKVEVSPAATVGAL